MDNALEFLRSGALMVRSSSSAASPAQEVVVGWGRVSRTESPAAGIPSFYAPDFFLKNPRPWWNFENVRVFSRKELVSRLKRIQAPSGALGKKDEFWASFRSPDQALFEKWFAEVQDRIQSGALKKAVPYVMKGSNESFDLETRRTALLGLLENSVGTSLIPYGIWDEEEGMLGATPELLFHLEFQKLTLSTVAIAGTRLKGRESESLSQATLLPASLLADPKERHEHQVVIDGISESLGRLPEQFLPVQISLGETLELELPSLFHLKTRIEVALRAGRGHEGLGASEPSQNEWVEELVRALHPTPALGAFPKGAGGSLLEQMERELPRSRFGAPFGVLDPELKTASLVVAIRNIQWTARSLGRSLARGLDRNEGEVPVMEFSVQMGAGCGIVEQSLCKKEWSELQGKLASIEKLMTWDEIPQAKVNWDLTWKPLLLLLEAGVRDFCVCPGARNAPWVSLLAELKATLGDRLGLFHFFDERSAAFFALGKIRAKGHPVAVVTTSGTAVGELLPATMEAYFSDLPLVLITADRPKFYRGSGAPQAAEQVGIFGCYARTSLDWESPDEVDLGSGMRLDLLRFPLHLNLCYGEPLLDPSLKLKGEQVGSVRRLLESPRTLPTGHVSLTLGGCEAGSFFRESRDPLVLLGMLNPEERGAVKQFLLEFQLPFYAEGISGLREDSELKSLQIFDGDRAFTKAPAAGYPVDGVLRIGGVPTLRLWRDLEGSSLPVLNLSAVPFSGLARSSRSVFSSCGGGGGNVSTLVEELARSVDAAEFCKQKCAGLSAYLQREREWEEGLGELCKALPNSEPGLLHHLSRALPSSARIFLGNSLPIREWDLAAVHQKRGFEVSASRGLNGIDGQVSTLLGWSQERSYQCGIFGDLTALYDLQAPWIIPQLGSEAGETVVDIFVVNNGGGKIFDRMFRQREFQNPHALRLKGWAELFGLEYQCWESIPREIAPPRQSRVIEMIPDLEATQRFWKSFQSL